jgi:hypothetical protein
MENTRVKPNKMENTRVKPNKMENTRVKPNKMENTRVLDRDIDKRNLSYGDPGSHEAANGSDRHSYGCP